VYVKTDKNSAEGRPFGLYGNAFSRAPLAAVQRATVKIEPPTTTNIFAMEAPPGGYGAYSRGVIEDVLVTAYTSFSAAKQETPAGKMVRSCCLY